VTAAGFEWTHPVDEIQNGRLEFDVAGDDAEGFFLVEVRYKTARLSLLWTYSPLLTFY
jgi:hypothetical protein